MSPRKKPYRPKSFESIGQSNDTSANLYESMLISPAFMDLSKNQKVLYLYMKAQYYGKRKPRRDFPGIPDLQEDDLFYFNKGLAEKYGLYKRDNHTQLYKDIKAIEEHGFIKTVSNGKITKSKSIYQFCDGWKLWKGSS